MNCENTHLFAPVGRLMETTFAATNKFRIFMFLALCLGAPSALLAQTLTTLYLFGGGGNPDGALVEGTDGNLYGVTAGGPGKEDGMIFKITPSGAFTMLHSGGGEYSGALVQGTDGNLYGTTGAGGTGPCSSGCGTVFRITTTGTLTTLHSFDPDGAGPNGGLFQASDGNFYGTTYSGGPNNSNCNSGSWARFLE